jgi:hypothetical protein
MRTRDWRRRWRAGAILSSLEVSAEGVSLLAALGWLTAERSNDPQAVGWAILAAVGAAIAEGLEAGSFRRPAADR